MRQERCFNAPSFRHTAEADAASDSNQLHAHDLMLHVIVNVAQITEILR